MIFCYTDLYQYIFSAIIKEDPPAASGNIYRDTQADITEINRETLEQTALNGKNSSNSFCQRSGNP